MAHDILLDGSPRSWARGDSPAPPAPRKIALGGMALGTALGLALITSPWWAKSFRPRPGRLARQPGDPYLHISPSGRIIANEPGSRLLGAVRFPYRPRG
jgi:hypothetical protein